MVPGHPRYRLTSNTQFQIGTTTHRMDNHPAQPLLSPKRSSKPDTREQARAHHEALIGPAWLTPGALYIQKITVLDPNIGSKSSQRWFNLTYSQTWVYCSRH